MYTIITESIVSMRAAFAADDRTGAAAHVCGAVGVAADQPLLSKMRYW